MDKKTEVLIEERYKHPSVMRSSTGRRLVGLEVFSHFRAREGTGITVSRIR